jgi:hypothetical protein
VILQFIGDKAMADKAAPGSISLATRLVIFNGRRSRHIIMSARPGVDRPEGPQN